MIFFFLFSFLFIILAAIIILFLFEMLLPALADSLNQKHILFSDIEAGFYNVTPEKQSNLNEEIVSESYKKTMAYRFWKFLYKFFSRIGRFF